MKKFALSSLLLALLAVGGISGVALAQDHMMHRMPMHDGAFAPDCPEHFAAELGLTQDQQDAAKKIHKAAFEQAGPLMEQHHAQMKEIHTLLDAGSASAEEIGTKLIAAHATQKQLEAIHTEAMAQFSALLNDEQKAKFEKMTSSHDKMPMMMHPGF
jgi:Spy/CpxP family protein refolding chaperone